MLISLLAFSQAKTTSIPLNSDRTLVEQHIRFLSSDALKGRRVLSEGIDVAGQYIADYYSMNGIKPFGDDDSYFQKVPLKVSQPAESGSMSVGKESFELGKNLVILAGKNLDLKQHPSVFAGHGWIDSAKNHDDYKGLDIKGKIVYVFPGTPESSSPQAVFEAMSSKRAWAIERGAVALIELYRLNNFPFQFFMNYFSKEQISLSKEDKNDPDQMTYAWIKETDLENLNSMKGKPTFASDLKHSGVKSKVSTCRNVVGLIQGSDPELSKEYILVTAHYDHVGVGEQGGAAYSEEDSIFNGARDNAIGVSALLSTAKLLAENRPQRSIIFAAVTAEEVGLLGSKYFADHTPVPIEQIIYNINTDGAGYNTTNAISVIGFGRTGVDDLLYKASKEKQLEIIPNPVPEQNLFDRSDNVSFAVKGIPAICISPGVTSFDAVLMKNYHQVSDEADTIDFDYVTKYCQIFAKSTQLIANWTQKPFWVTGDKYEDAGKKLYGLE
jgi:hypothetical protein